MSAARQAARWARHVGWVAVAVIAASACRRQAQARLRSTEAQWRDRLHHELLPRIDAAELALARSEPAQSDLARARRLLAEASTATRALLEAPPGRSAASPAVAEAVAQAERTWGTRLGPTRLRVDDALPRLPARTTHALTAIVTESLTNVARHRPGAEVTVGLAALDVEVLLTITSRGGQPVPRPSPDGGYGTVALQRTVADARGVLHQQPLHDGHVVTARLPAGHGGRRSVRRPGNPTSRKRPGRRLQSAGHAA